jgi:hemerythrin-like domain-containing protein
MGHEQDSSKLRAEIRTVVHALPEAPRDDVVVLLSAIARTIRARLHVEETVLFTAIERVASMPTLSAMATLRTEHNAIRDLLGEIEQGVAADHRDAIAGNLRELEAMIRAHDDFEARVLPPLVERLLDSADVVRSLARAAG